MIFLGEIVTILLDKNSVNPDSSDELGSVDTTFLRFKKYYQRILFGTDRQYLNTIQEFDPLDGYEFVDEETKKELIKSAPEHDLIVVGHSLDVTDKDIITELFDISSSITVMYHNDAAFADHVNNLVNIYILCFSFYLKRFPPMTQSSLFFL